MMRRREFITLLGGAAIWPVAAHAQQPMPVIGYLSALRQADSAHFDAALRRGLAEMGYVEGHNVAIESHWITERYDPLPAMAGELVQRHVNVIVAGGPPAVLAAKAATASIPIVFVTGAGIWMVTTVLAEKRLQLVHDLVPNAESVALLVNPTSPVADPQVQDAQAAAGKLNLKLSVMTAVTESDFDRVFATLAQQRTNALLVSADPFFSSRREHFVALAARHAIPTIYEFREFVEAGGLMSYGPVLPDGYYRGGLYAGRILKGAKPADLPVEQTNKLELVINLKTAKALDLEVPPTLLVAADEVIE
jgi:putative ABC transport system substrate-binding protein